MSTDVRQQFQLPTQRGNIRGESLDRRNLTMLDPTSEPEPIARLCIASPWPASTVR
ncbi:hypothetical protein ACIBEK_34105 [Nocardia fusca]|uniref:hypothetical protein n=1 Tax=Nocardia fusca TaxID=941183 RepID=UPI00378E28CC